MWKRAAFSRIERRPANHFFDGPKTLIKTVFIQDINLKLSFQHRTFSVLLNMVLDNLEFHERPEAFRLKVMKLSRKLDLSFIIVGSFRSKQTRYNEFNSIFAQEIAYTVYVIHDLYNLYTI